MSQDIVGKEAAVDEDEKDDNCNEETEERKKYTINSLSVDVALDESTTVTSLWNEIYLWNNTKIFLPF